MNHKCKICAFELYFIKFSYKMEIIIAEILFTSTKMIYYLNTDKYFFNAHS